MTAHFAAIPAASGNQGFWATQGGTSAGHGAGSPRSAEGSPTNTDRKKEGRATTSDVLVVDDNQDAAEMLSLLLQSWGWTVRVAHDGKRALRLVDDDVPAVALLDIGLPEMDGYELASRIRDRHGPAVKLVAVTGYGQQSDRDRAREAGFDEHLVKPVDAARLRQCLQGLLSA